MYGSCVATFTVGTGKLIVKERIKIVFSALKNIIIRC